MNATIGSPGADSSADSAALGASRSEYAVANISLAVIFFASAIPISSHYRSEISTAIWSVGAVMMGLFSLVRVPPRTVDVSWRALLAYAGMTVPPVLMRPGVASAGIPAAAGIGLEFIGVVLSQVARLYMGRRFGVFPADRGVVSRGPFAIVRHPIYLGWVILSIGFLCSYPTGRNLVLIIASLPFLVWRIKLEERHLALDPGYCAYQDRVRFRLVPGVL
jgi:protein-S-isoprenylcysteine O-methyltransferase Ste14